MVDGTRSLEGQTKIRSRGKQSSKNLSSILLLIKLKTWLYYGHEAGMEDDTSQLPGFIVGVHTRNVLESWEGPCLVWW